VWFAAATMFGIFANRKRETLVKLIGNYPRDHPEL
jgi:hypothetical protein